MVPREMRVVFVAVCLWCNSCLRLRCDVREMIHVFAHIHSFTTEASESS
jgi:hypothetical protein